MLIFALMILSIVVPCFDEAETLPVSVPRLVSMLVSMIQDDLVSDLSRILLVNDGSSDNTWQIINGLHEIYPLVHGLDLVSNVGQQNALLAGIFAEIIPDCMRDMDINAPGVAANSHLLPPADAVVTIDADLQDSLACIPQMVCDFKKGYDVVYGVRKSRTSDSAFKRFSAESFYKLQSSLGLKTIFNHADFRLMSRRVVLELHKYEERNIYLRGIIPMMGYPYTVVEEERHKRVAGKSKYPFRRMLSLAFDGISSFSVRPMYLILALGAVSIAIALAIAVYVIISLCSGDAAAGWASLMLSIWLVGGMLMVSIGLVGLYIGKVYLETKHRPRYHINRILR